MKTKRFLSTAVALLTMLAIIGAGFSLWFFGTNVANESNIVGANIDQTVTMGNITPAGDITINFDQTATGRENNGSNVTFGSADATNGIYLTFAGDNSEVVYTPGANTPATSEFTFEVKLTVPTALVDYITVSSTDGWTVSNAGGVYTITKAFTGNTAVTFDWDNITVAYATGKEPANADQLNALKTIVDAGGFAASYTVTLATNG